MGGSIRRGCGGVYRLELFVWIPAPAAASAWPGHRANRPLFEGFGKQKPSRRGHWHEGFQLAFVTLCKAAVSKAKSTGGKLVLGRFTDCRIGHLACSTMNGQAQLVVFSHHRRAEPVIGVGGTNGADRDR